MAPPLANYRQHFPDPDARTVHRILTTLLEALEALHSRGLFHQNINSCHILMRRADEPVLIGFPTPLPNRDESSFSPFDDTPCATIEQSLNIGEPGPWTDIYALAAALYTFLTDEPPPQACAMLATSLPGQPPASLESTRYKPLVLNARLRARHSLQLLSGIDRALSVWPENRWQTAREWREALAAEPSPLELPPGYALGDYSIERTLARGGFGMSYLALSHLTGTRVVIKELLPRHAAARHMPESPQVTISDSDAFSLAREDFLHEARLLTLLQHPGVVHAIGTFSALNTVYYVMPCLDGVPLDRFCRSHPAPHEEGLRELLGQLLDTLEYLHGQNVYHLDIKPSNIIVSPLSSAMLIDFGSSRLALRRGKCSTIVSRDYTAPELMRNEGSIGPEADIYALGATFYKLITGRTPPPVPNDSR